VFTDNGVIVGTPFPLGDASNTPPIPAGATQLQLGIDDDGFSDNDGYIWVQIQGPAAPVPEPASFLLISFPLLGLAAFKYRRSASLPR
jgi:hypothetical protein